MIVDGWSFQNTTAAMLVKLPVLVPDLLLMQQNVAVHHCTHVFDVLFTQQSCLICNIFPESPRPNKTSHPGTFLGMGIVLAGQFWWRTKRMACCSCQHPAILLAPILNILCYSQRIYPYVMKSCLSPPAKQQEVWGLPSSTSHSNCYASLRNTLSHIPCQVCSHAVHRNIDSDDCH
jgi:hypothetical protein